MEEGVRCQSCGIKFEEGFWGSEKNGEKSREYCKFCYQEGVFLMPDLEVEDMVALAVHNMVDDLGMDMETAKKIANEEIYQLKRWKGLSK